MKTRNLVIYLPTFSRFAQLPDRCIDSQEANETYQTELLHLLVGSRGINYFLETRCSLCKLCKPFRQGLDL